MRHGSCPLTKFLFTIPTVRGTTTFRLTRFARQILGSDRSDTLYTVQRAIRNYSFLRDIKTFDVPIATVHEELLILTEEYYRIFHMNKTTAARVRALKKIIFDSPDISEQVKASVSLVFAMYNLHTFGNWNVDPEKMYEKVHIEGVRP